MRLVARPGLRLLACAAALLLGGCAPALPDTGTEPPAGVVDAVRAYSDATAEYASGNWDESARRYREAADAATGDARLAGLRGLALYNLACVEARAGRTSAAAAAFADSIAGGLRTPTAAASEAQPSGPAMALTLEHILADPDLDAIRDEPAYRSALAPYLDAPDGDPTGLAVIVVSDPERGRLGTIHPPIDLRGGAGTPPDRRWMIDDGVLRWTLDDGDLRWGVARVRRAVGELAGGNASRQVELSAKEEDASRVVWAAALEMPEHVAAITVSGVTTPRGAWEDALARVPERRKGLAPWRVVVGRGDDVIAEALAKIGVTATRSAH